MPERRPPIGRAPLAPRVIVVQQKPQQKKGGSGARILGIVCIIGLAAIISLVSNEPSVNTDIANVCRSDPQQFSSVIDSWEGNGTIRAMSGDRIEVDDAAWARAPHNAKVSIAVSYYCRVADSQGRGTIFVKGYRDGKTKASVSDGHYSD